MTADLDTSPPVAPRPRRHLRTDNAIPTAGLLAQALSAKYLNRLPLYRQGATP